jgi:uncharacterized repeat protein (TIGR01451 family)
MRLFTFLAVLFFGFVSSAQTVDDFVFEVDLTTSSSVMFEITASNTVTVDWGDGSNDSYSNVADLLISHTYSSQAAYTVIVNNQMDSFKFDRIINPVTVNQWGTTTWQTMFEAFKGCGDLTFTTTDTPDLSQVTNMSSMFWDAISFNQSLDSWDVSNVTNMSFMFWEASSFNQPLNSWDVTAVTDMSSMFKGANAFDQPLNSWDVSTVITTSFMFRGASSFNQYLDSWDVSNVTDMSSMFWEASSFNQPLDSWDVSSVTDLSEMFQDAAAFNQPINTWDVSNVIDMTIMFAGASSFDQPINTWDVSAVTSMSSMFWDAINFNQDLSSWSYNATVDIGGFITNSGMDVTHYDSLLQRFVQLTFSLNSPTSGSSFEAIGLEYCDSFSREILIQNGWSFIGDALSNSCSNTALSGDLQYDVNNNGCDNSDPYLNNIALEINDGTNTVVAYTNTSGRYIINMPDGTYAVTPVVDASLFTAIPATVVITAGVPVTQDFCLSATTSPVDDLEISMVALEDANAGFETNYKLIYKNKGNTVLSGSIDLTYEDNYMDLLIATPGATGSSTDNLNWSFSNLNPFEIREIEVSMNLNTDTDSNFPLYVNNVLDFTVDISPASGDVTPLDNVFNYEHRVIDSFNSNDKTCLQGVRNTQALMGEYVHYRIRFENEGTANATNLKIIDYIDTTKFDITTLEPISASHDYITTISTGNKVEFQFDDIILPFTAPASQGYVLFKIKTLDTLVAGDDFSNQAEIYFDFNLPINTNLETTEVTLETAADFVFTVDDIRLLDFEITTAGTVTIQWGDGSSDTYNNVTDQPISHSYSSQGSYTVIINNQLDSFNFSSFSKPLTIDQWGSTLWKTMYRAFFRCEDLNISAVDIPDLGQVTSLEQMFAGAVSFNSDLSDWDVSNVTDMSGMFYNVVFVGATSSFNQPLNNWNVSNVINMSQMFDNAESFNQPLSNWDVANVTNMQLMFLGARSFNQPLNNWNVSNVEFMNAMFSSANNFNQDLSSWNFNMNAELGAFVANSGLNVSNYDALLQRYVQLNLPYNAVGIFDPNSLEYCDNFSRDILIQNGWPISGDSQSSTCPANTLSGSIFYDFDLNGCDPSDLESQNVAITIIDGTNALTVYTYNGQYSVNLPDGTYTITPNINNALFTATPVNVNVTLSNAVTVTQDFCLTATSPINDLEITILPLEDARPGFDTNYKLIYKNKGTTILSGSVDFTYEDDFMDFLNSNPATTSSSVGMLSWDFIDLDPFETREMEFTMNMNTPTDPTFPLNSNDLLDFSATINPTTNDNTPLDNVFDLQQTVVNSYDPNDKTCLQGATILPTMVGEYVQYRIRFENEGTASAITVRIVDYIDTSKFDIATLTPLSASHDYTTTITEGNKVEFQFDNIMLPFTAPASQGYVLFKIKTVDTLVLGDDFSNQAEIYFDFNFPIITNLETTAVAVPLSLNENNLLEVRLFPNPAQNSVSVTSNLEFHQYTIYNTLGAVVSQQKLESPALSHHIQVNHLVSGLYFVEVKGDQGSFVVKMIKE